jgi:hypothetical protein
MAMDERGEALESGSGRGRAGARVFGGAFGPHARRGSPRHGGAAIRMVA